MKKVYISSTYFDLIEHRRAVYDILRKMRLDPISMEDYPAVETRPLSKCLSDIKEADLYIGIFAWRYGYVPDSSVGTSITEREYEGAGHENKHRLIFLARESARWPANVIDGISDDSEGITKILALRKRLKTERSVRFFESPDELAALVAISVYNYLLKESLAKAIDEAISIQIREGALKNDQINSSQLLDILEYVVNHQANALLVNIGTGWSWWSTRLYLLAALAVDVTETQLLVFVDSNDQFVGMASPRYVRQALVARFRYLQQWEQKLEAEGKLEFANIQEVPARAEEFRAMMDALGKEKAGKGGTEENVKTWIRKNSLAGMLGANLQTTLIDLDTNDHFASAVLDVVRQPSTYVAVIHHKERRIIDRLQLNTRISSVLLNNWSLLLMS